MAFSWQNGGGTTTKTSGSGNFSWQRNKIELPEIEEQKPSPSIFSRGIEAGKTVTQPQPQAPKIDPKFTTVDGKQAFTLPGGEQFFTGNKQEELVTVDRDKDGKLIRPPKSVIDEVRGGSFDDVNAEVDHGVSLFAGGTNERTNLRPLSNDVPFWERYKAAFNVFESQKDVEERYRQAGKVVVENEARKKLDSGELTLGQARNMIVNWESQNPKTAKDFFLTSLVQEYKKAISPSTQIKNLTESTPFQIGKGIGKEILATAGSVLDFLHRTGLQVITAGSAVVSPLVVSGFKKFGTGSIINPKGDKDLQNISYDDIWSDSLKEWEERALAVGMPIEDFKARLFGREPEPMKLFEEQEKKAAQEYIEAKGTDESLKAFSKSFLKIGWYKFVGDWSNPFYVFKVRGLSKDSFKLQSQEKVLANFELNPAKENFLGMKGQKVKPSEKVYKVDSDATETLININKKGKVKIGEKPELKIYVSQNKSGVLNVKVTNSGGDILNKNAVQYVADNIVNKYQPLIGETPKAITTPRVPGGIAPVAPPITPKIPPVSPVTAPIAPEPTITPKAPVTPEITPVVPEVKIEPKTPVTAPEVAKKAIVEPVKPEVKLLPTELKPLVESAKKMGLTKNQFIEEFNKGLNEQNLTKRETAQKIDSYIKLKLRQTPEQFYDTYIAVEKPEVPKIPEAKVEVPKVEPIPKELQPLTVEAKKYKSVEEFIENNIQQEKDNLIKPLKEKISELELRNTRDISPKISESIIRQINKIDKKIISIQNETKDIGDFIVDSDKFTEKRQQLTDIYNKAQAKPVLEKVVKPEVVKPKIETELAKFKKLSYAEQEITFDKLSKSDQEKVYDVDIVETDLKKKLESDILLQGGVKMSPAEEIEYKEVVPIRVRRKNGLLPDVMAQQLKSMGWNVELTSRSFFELVDKHISGIEAKEKYESVKLTSGIDPGINKFIAEEIKPTLKKAKEAGVMIAKAVQYLGSVIVKTLEPSKLVEMKLGKEPYAKVIRGIHKPEARLLQFDYKKLATLDKNIMSLEIWFNKYSDKILENFMLSRGDPSSANALIMQQEAINNLPSELKTVEIKNAIQEIADFNYEFLQRVVGKDINKIKDYFYGIYKNYKKVDKFLDHWKETKRFTKEKKFPTFADAKEYGLELRNNNPVTNLKQEFKAIAQLDAMNWLKDELLRTGNNKYISKKEDAPIEWDKVEALAFRGLRVEPNLAKLINNLISTNKITRQPILNTFRKINNVLRTTKFIGSAFHLAVIGKQSVADSGYLGFIRKKTALSGATIGFRENDLVFKTVEYEEYVELGGGHKYSIESEAQRGLSNVFDKINRGNYLGGLTKIGMIPIKIPTKFVEWMFSNYIPKVKYAKYLEYVNTQEKKLGRELKDSEKIEIIKEGQNFYGEMNERLFGRSGTVTTALRFVFMAPGFAEGNYRTIIKGLSQFGAKGTYRAGRSRFNILNSLILTATLATIGTLAFTRKAPEKPEKLEDVRDLFKIDTGYKDDKDRRIMIDMLTYDKDYWNILFNVMKGRPDKVVSEAITRLGGMKASTFEMLTDMTLLLQGRALVDWKNDEVVETTDPFLKQVQKIGIYELKRLEPISVSVYKQIRNKKIGILLSAISSLAGVRPTYTEEDKMKQKIISRVYSLKGQQEELYQYLKTINNPEKAIEDYNKTVNNILDSDLVSDEIRKEWKPKLEIDTEQFLGNKIYNLTDPTVSQDEFDKLLKYLVNFDIDNEKALDYLNKSFKDKNTSDNVIKERTERFNDRISGDYNLDEFIQNKIYNITANNANKETSKEFLDEYNIETWNTAKDLLHQYYKNSDSDVKQWRFDNLEQYFK